MLPTRVSVKKTYKTLYVLDNASFYFRTSLSLLGQQLQRKGVEKMIALGREDGVDDREGTPDDREGTPDDREGTPDDREGTPDDREGTPDDR